MILYILFDEGIETDQSDCIKTWMTEGSKPITSNVDILLFFAVCRQTRGLQILSTQYQGVLERLKWPELQADYSLQSATEF